MDLKKELKINNISKAELSRKMGVTWVTVNNWCKNPNKLTLEKLQKIRRFLE